MPSASVAQLWRNPLLIATALVFLGLFLFVPLAAVWVEAFKKGFGPYFTALADAETLSAIGLTLTVAAVSVPLNLIFGGAINRAG